MSEVWQELALAVAFLELALAFWLLVHQHWRAGGGASVAFLAAIPLATRAMVGTFSLPGLLIAAAGILAGVALALSDFRCR
ncbi:hypothetical protein [Sphingomonas immobilis]|uniref:Uncharacterized protein n=1 Tax=Sphingomonas immobilis TaxID=3063997 RepID=A0ABT8ZWE0_9SPHN|nr:hypothetical protein [Sphingomonas sp. CA1-15]MDO7841873.1 hypothetical protein [Sphingomonas sp. CA1-15]